MIVNISQEIYIAYVSYLVNTMFIIYINVLSDIEDTKRRGGMC